MSARQANHVVNLQIPGAGFHIGRDALDVRLQPAHGCAYPGDFRSQDSALCLDALQRVEHGDTLHR